MAVTITAAELARRIAGAAADDAATAEQLLNVARARVEDYAPSAPEAVQNEAVVRFAGYLSQADFGTVRREEVGPRSVEYPTNHANAWHNSGAAMLLTRWARRRAGTI